MKHLKPFFENNRSGRNKVMNYCAIVEDIINYEPEMGERESDDVDILASVRKYTKDINMTEEELKLAIEDLNPKEAKIVSIILDEIIKENERLANANYILSKDEIMDIIQNYTDVIIPMNSLVGVLSNYKRES